MDNILVSIIIISYNSEKYILEALNSAFYQTYNNLELVISDDGSKDATITIAQRWLNQNGSRFVRYSIIKTDTNTGIAGNCNRGIKQSRGEWIRLIAGDDILPPDSITNLVNEISSEKLVIIGSHKKFIVRNEEKVFLPTIQINEIYPYFFCEDASFQHNFILNHYNIGLTQGSLINRRIFDNICMFDERFQMIEDLPFWLNITKNGIKLWYSNSLVTYYRIHNSLSRTNNHSIANKYFKETKLNILSNMIAKEIPFYNCIFYETLFLEKLTHWFTFVVFRNKVHIISRITLRLLNIMNLQEYRNLLIDSYYMHQWRKNNN